MSQTVCVTMSRAGGNRIGPTRIGKSRCPHAGAFGPPGRGGVLSPLHLPAPQPCHACRPLRTPHLRLAHSRAPSLRAASSSGASSTSSPFPLPPAPPRGSPLAPSLPTLPDLLGTLAVFVPSLLSKFRPHLSYSPSVCPPSRQSHAGPAPAPCRSGLMPGP